MGEPPKQSPVKVICVIDDRVDDGLREMAATAGAGAHGHFPPQLTADCRRQRGPAVVSRSHCRDRGAAIPCSLGTGTTMEDRLGSQRPPGFACDAASALFKSVLRPV